VLFLICVIDHQTGLASDAEMAAIDEFNEGLRSADHWVFAGGLQSPATALLIDGRNDVDPLPASLDSAWPQVQSPEYVSGFWIIDVPSAEIAHALAREGSRACNRRVVLRQFLS
jgi:hypothetical protein